MNRKEPNRVENKIKMEKQKQKQQQHKQKNPNTQTCFYFEGYEKVFLAEATFFLKLTKGEVIKKWKNSGNLFHVLSKSCKYWNWTTAVQKNIKLA